jgi:hypothetical protein
VLPTKAFGNHVDLDTYPVGEERAHIFRKSISEFKACPVSSHSRNRLNYLHSACLSVAYTLNVSRAVSAVARSTIAHVS